MSQNALGVISTEINKQYKSDDNLLSLLKSLATYQSSFEIRAQLIRSNEDRQSVLLEYINPIDKNIYNILKHMIDKNYNIDSAKRNFVEIISNNYNYMNDNKESIGHKMIKDFIERIETEKAATPKLNEPILAPDTTKLTNKQLIPMGKEFINKLICRKCHKNYVNMVLIPCGHLVCSTCARIIQKEKTLCPICLRQITNINDIYYIKYLKYKNKYLNLKNKNLFN